MILLLTIQHLSTSVSVSVLHLDVEEWSEELLRQLSYAIKNQLEHPKPPTRVFACPTLVLYGIRAPMKVSTNESRASTFLDQ